MYVCMYECMYVCMYVCGVQWLTFGRAPCKHGQGQMVGVIVMGVVTCDLLLVVLTAPNNFKFPSR